MSFNSQYLYGNWKELESSSIYKVTSADWDNPYLRNLTVVNNPAKMIGVTLRSRWGIMDV